MSLLNTKDSFLAISLGLRFPLRNLHTFYPFPVLGPPAREAEVLPEINQMHPTPRAPRPLPQLLKPPREPQCFILAEDKEPRFWCESDPNQILISPFSAHVSKPQPQRGAMRFSGAVSGTQKMLNRGNNYQGFRGQLSKLRTA